jgi:hypothetical protein
MLNRTGNERQRAGVVAIQLRGDHQRWDVLQGKISVTMRGKA